MQNTHKLNDVLQATMVTSIHDYIETMILRDQANEELYFDTLAHKVGNKSTPYQTHLYFDEKIEVTIDDRDHKFHIHHHS